MNGGPSALGAPTSGVPRPEQESCEGDDGKRRDAYEEGKESHTQR